MNDQQAKNKAQDKNIDNSQMSLNDKDAQKNAMPKEDTSSFSLTDYFKTKAREKVMNSVMSSTQDTPDSASQPSDNSPSANKPKPSPKDPMKPTKLVQPTPKMISPKIPSMKTPSMKMPKLR